MTRRRRVQKSGLQTHEFPASFGARRFPKGNEGKRVSSGYNRRRRLATRSSGKQQAERTAVRTAPIVCPEESPLVRPQAHTPVPEWPDAPTTARLVGLPPRGGQYFLSKRKKVPKKAGGTATPEAARPGFALFANIGVSGTAVPGSCICSGLPVANCLRQLCPLGTRSLSAQASACGSRTVGRPEFIRGVQFRPLGRNSLTTFRGQTALRGCPRARGVRCRIAPCRSLCSPPTLPAGRFGLRPRPHWGHASLRDSSLPSPAGKKPYIAHF